MKGPTEKHFDGIYANPRLMHSVGQIVGCLVQVQVKNGSVYEGVLRTISNKADFVLEVAQKIDLKASANANTVIYSSNPDDNFEKIVFNFNDVVMLTSFNVDPEFATRESFTDTAISKFNGQVLERELEPWDGETSSDGLLDLGTGEEEANGWDPQDMFKTNEEKYGVKSSFDKNLAGYTIPLNKQNTEEYRQKEEKADKVATEIESSLHHKNRAALENGDEEDRFSAVVRPDNLNNFKFVPHRQRRSAQNMRNMRNNNGTASHMNNRNSHQHTQVFQRISSPATTATNSSTHYRQAPSSGSNCVSPRQTPAPSPRQAPAQQQSQAPSSSGQFQSAAAATSPVQAVRTTPPQASSSHEDSHKMNGEVDKTELKFAPKPPRSLNLHMSANKEMRDSMLNPQMPNKNADRRKDSEKKTPGQKTRDEKTEDLKRFHAKFKLSEDPKDSHERDSSKSDVPSSVNANTPLPPKHHSNKERQQQQKEEERRTPDSRKSPDTPKNYTLNPNAKEFVFNPNAKSFTPRGAPMQNVGPPPVQQPPPRLHTQSPIMAMQPHMMPQTVFTPHYVVSATPVSMAQMAPPFNPAAVAQAPRFRKAMPMTLRHDLSQQVHVQAATGQPILAQPTLSAAPQFTIQYTPPGMLHPPGPPQQLAYTQMYSLMPRMLNPQPVSMVPTSAAYGESPQIPTHVYMSHPAGPGIQHAMTSGGNGGQHSTPSTPQSQTPNIHPAPSPVHQQPPPAPTPTGHSSNAPTPQPVMYTTHGHMAAQHHMHAAHQSTGQGHPFAAPYPGGPQPIVLLQQQPHHPGSFASSLQNHLHAQNAGGSHVGTPTHMLPHAPLAMIPTSAGMVHSQTAGHYVPHSQV